ncbi:MAG: cysteine hydrolase [Desulfobacteraceae bacterium]|nr:cysteine hydrolase [Desulfobacteraceae bacterium]MBU4001654.1 cysteine hydrolase [Pseudomonadota bacterium]MBU4055790.1 cysteine hydrolase [Pseudomonadota bacterium]
MSNQSIQKFIENNKLKTPEIIPGKSALLIIDMQEYQVRKKWASYKLTNAGIPGVLDYFMEQSVSVVEPNIRKLIDFYRENGLQIIYTMFSSLDIDGKDLNRGLRDVNKTARQFVGDPIFPHKDHPGSKIVDSLKPDEHDLIVHKSTSNVFVSTKIELILKNMGIEQLFITGVVTNGCVEGAARTAADLGFDVFLVDDACGAWSPEIHKNSLQSISLWYGFVMRTDEALSGLREKISS